MKRLKSSWQLVVIETVVVAILSLLPTASLPGQRSEISVESETTATLGFDHHVFSANLQSSTVAIESESDLGRIKVDPRPLRSLTREWRSRSRDDASRSRLVRLQHRFGAPLNRLRYSQRLGDPDADPDDVATV